MASSLYHWVYLVPWIFFIMHARSLMESSFVFQIFVDFELDFLGAFGVGLEYGFVGV